MILRRNEITVPKNIAEAWNFSQNRILLWDVLWVERQQGTFLYILLLYRGYYSMSQCIERLTQKYTEFVWNIAITSIPKSTNFSFWGNYFYCTSNTFCQRLLKNLRLKLRTFYYCLNLCCVASNKSLPYQQIS